MYDQIEKVRLFGMGVAGIKAKADMLLNPRNKAIKQMTTNISRCVQADIAAMDVETQRYLIEKQRTLNEEVERLKSISSATSDTVETAQEEERQEPVERETSQAQAGNPFNGIDINRELEEAQQAIFNADRDSIPNL